MGLDFGWETRKRHLSIHKAREYLYMEVRIDSASAAPQHEGSHNARTRGQPLPSTSKECIVLMPALSGEPACRGGAAYHRAA